ncbi:fimbrial protein [Shewanella xiamenensis]|uniref:fimbrial protein n=1 Tax=Shewanella xiamenensis TaxID=332186 RepID=UPI0035B7F687
MKVNKSFLALAVVVGFSGSTVHAQAADGTINFTGLVVAGACTAVANVNANGTIVAGTNPTATLNLPTVNANALNVAAGTYAGQTPFSIELSNCQQATGLNNVRAEFTSASTPAGDNHVMANTATGASVAGDVAVAIMQRNGTTQIDLHNGPAKDVGAALPATAANLTLEYKAAYKSLTTSVTPGNVAATADFVISYF